MSTNMLDKEGSPFEDKRTALAILLCLVVVMVYSEYVFAPYSRQPVVAPEGATQTTNQQNPTVSAQTGTPSSVVAAPMKSGIPSVAEINSGGRTVIETNSVVISLTHLGGRIESLQLKKYKKAQGNDANYEMVLNQEGEALPLGVYAGPVDDNFVKYSVSSISGANLVGNKYTATGSDVSVVLQGKLSNGTEISKILTLRSDSYLFDVNVKLGQTTPDGSRLKLEWSYFEPNLDKLKSYDFHGIERLSGGSIVKTPFTKEADNSEAPGSDTWIAIGDKYFMAAMIPTSDGQNTNFIRHGNSFLIRAAGDTNGGQFKFFIGPKEFYTLKAAGFDLHKAIDLGFFSALAHPLLDVLRFFHRVFGNWGLSIVLLTLLIKGLFLPLTKKSFKSMAAMQEVQPRIKALREKFQNDPNKMNQELIALYKREGINPMGGCLPMLIQLPVFLGLYNSLLNSIELRHAPFALWITDLSAPERLEMFGVGIPVMVILMGISMFIQQWTMPSAMDPMQKKIMMFMPVVFTFFFLGFPAGLVLYWLVNNVVSIIQQSYIRKEKFAGATKATVVAGVAMFGFAYILVLLS